MPPINVLPLFDKLDELLISLLKNLHNDDWQKPTIAKKWNIKDIAAHLLDGNLRTISMLRDRYPGETQPIINNYEDLVQYLNRLNSDWVQACKRLSPALLIYLLETSGKDYSAYLSSLDPFATAVFPVAWAGETQSPNWFHISREYTEKFLHQQQIRDALKNDTLFTREFFYPFINTFMYGLPHTFRNTNAKQGTLVQVTVSTAIGGSWFVQRSGNTWQLNDEPTNAPSAKVELDPKIAWKLFSKGITPSEAIVQTTFEGDKELAAIVLEMVSVMA